MREIRRHDTHSPSRAFMHRNRYTVAALVPQTAGHAQELQFESGVESRQAGPV